MFVRKTKKVSAINKTNTAKTGSNKDEKEGAIREKDLVQASVYNRTYNPSTPYATFAYNPGAPGPYETAKTGSNKDEKEERERARARREYYEKFIQKKTNVGQASAITAIKKKSR